jgi:hypothetical protein
MGVRIYHRPSTTYLIIIEPNGILYKISYAYLSDVIFMMRPCYAPRSYLREVYLGVYRQRWAKYPTRSAAIKAMRKYDRDVAYIGSI